MYSRLEKIKESFDESIKNVSSTADLMALKVKYLGKNGEFSEIMKELKNVPQEEKPALGQAINRIKTQIEALFGEKEDEIEKLETQKKLESEKVDIYLPGKTFEPGTLHPLTIVKNQILDVLMDLGFEVYDGPEIETDYYCFEALNIPADHPARDMQDTFYITDDVVLRPHTSPAQVRAMLSKGVPIRILCPGKVFRSDDDATHSPMFHQIEGLAIEKNLSLCDLKGVLEEFARALFSKDTKVRFRPSYFPFTEPSVEVDLSCSVCGGKGCRLCKGTGWIEVLGAGMVNRNVLTNCNVDPDVYKGFAFGIGIERIAMIKYGLPDMRLLFENDVRFLKQFK